MRAVVALALLATVTCSVFSRQKREVCDLGSEKACEIVRELSLQMIASRLEMEERTRSEGDSGIKQVRVHKHCTKPYYCPSHAGGGAASIHDHSNDNNTVGMGEFIAVLNGVEFRARHSDYKLMRPSITSKEYHATEDIEFPEVPQSVKNKETVKEQIEEMKEYFRAFHEQNTAIRDYKPYFKPVISYLEGAWQRPSENLDDSVSDRHEIDAASWEELIKKILYTSASGNKDSEENYAYLPRKVSSLDPFPQFSQYNYRILCHPLNDDLPLNRFRVVDDLAAQMAFKTKYEDMKLSRRARFQLNPDNDNSFQDGPYTYGLLDELMGQIPGKENYQGDLRDDAFGREVMNPKDDKPLNAAFYYSQYKEKKKDASGLQYNSKGFSDANLFVALTEQEQIVPHNIENCEKLEGSEETVCESYNQRWSYAIPLEIIYLTPLTKWNPYNLKMQANDKIPLANGRDGSSAKPLDGISRRIHFMTPAEFFTKGRIESDAADTSGGEIYVQDQDGMPRKVVASGLRIMLPEIEGIGLLRQRYPIFPVHSEGSSIMKELSALKELVTHPVTYKYMLREGDEEGGDSEENEEEEDRKIPLRATFVTPPSVVESFHTHKIELNRKELKKLIYGQNLWVHTEQTETHSHFVKLEAKKVENVEEGYELSIILCDEKPMPCWDGHDGNDGKLSLIAKHW